MYDSVGQGWADSGTLHPSAIGGGERVEAQERRLSVSGLALRVREWMGDGPPIVLLHGLASNSRIWDDVAARLVTRFHVVALDQRGHGLSDRPRDGFAFDKVTGDVRAVVDALGLERPTVVGHSWGGNVALVFAATYPEITRALVLVDGGLIEPQANPDMTLDRLLVELEPPDLTTLTFQDLIERVRSGDAGTYWGPAVEATMRTSFEDTPDGRIAPRLTRDNHLQIIREMWELRPSELFSKVTCPTLLVPARRSNPTGRAAQRLTERQRQIERAMHALPDGRLLWMEETVHDVPLQRPTELADAIAEIAVSP
jgi:pimeloyl-ACP methyl ester carboxylesterase